jgi:hypothetical protein
VLGADAKAKCLAPGPTFQPHADRRLGRARQGRWAGQHAASQRRCAHAVQALYVIIVDRTYGGSAQSNGDQVVPCGKGQGAYTLALLDALGVPILGIRGIVDVNGLPEHAVSHVHRACFIAHGERRQDARHCGHDAARVAEVRRRYAGCGEHSIREPWRGGANAVVRILHQP